MLEWVGIPGDTGTRRIAWRGWKVMNDWNVRNVSGVSGKTGKTGMSLEGFVRHTDAFLEDLLAFYAQNFFSGIWNEGVFALCNVVVVFEELFVFCM